jgi:hypothetical protein
VDTMHQINAANDDGGILEPFEPEPNIHPETF